AGRPRRARPCRQPLRVRPRAPLGGRRRPAREPRPQHPVRRSCAHREGAPHRPARGAGRARRGGPAMKRRDGLLVLDDGTTFEGDVYGDATLASGEVVFNTALSGYQEIITDPSYAGQVITFTYPHIGNYGVNEADFES